MATEHLDLILDGIIFVAVLVLLLKAFGVV